MIGILWVVIAITMFVFIAGATRKSKKDSIEIGLDMDNAEVKGDVLEACFMSDEKMYQIVIGAKDKEIATIVLWENFNTKLGLLAKYMNVTTEEIANGYDKYLEKAKRGK